MPTWLQRLRKFITTLTDILISGREAGLWQKGNVPVVGHFTEKPQALLGAGRLKKRIKRELVEAGLRNVQSRIDTPQERKVILDGVHVPGMTEQSAWMVSIGLALANALLEVLASSSPELLLTDWKLWLHGIGVALVSKFLLWLKQDSHNATAVIKQQTFVDVANVTTAPKE